MLAKLLKNDVFANLTFVLVIVVGVASYLSMPRQQDPEINFNWIQVVTTLPGASAEDIEKRVTGPIEEAIQNITDIRFAISHSRDNISNILIRFNDLSERDFDKRVADLRREIQNKEAELPEDAEQPFIFELTSSSGFPTATVLIVGAAYDESLRRYAKRVNRDLTRFKEVNRILDYGFSEPELQINILPEQLIALGINPSDVANNILSSFRDSSAGDIDVGGQSWLVRLQGINSNPETLGETLIRTPESTVPLNEVARVERGREQAVERISYNGQPSIMLAVTKSANVNALTLVEKVKQYIAERNEFSSEIGAELVLMDDQTEATRSALSVMQSNALLGLTMVLLVTFIFVGFTMSILTSIAIPFVLAGVFWILNMQGETLNIMVLLGVVISLGMLVDDAVVVVESIYYRLERGASAIDASVEGLKEVFAPVTASVLTTIAAFLPLMLLPGILGQFLKLVPLVVTLALILSLIEAYWMLPAHIIGFKVKLDNTSKGQRRRQLFLRNLRHRYSQLLIKALRRPWKIFISAFGALVLAIIFVASGLVKPDFFASDTLRLFYINVEMPPGTPLQKTLDVVEAIEQDVRKTLNHEELRSVVSSAGHQFTDTSPLSGNVFGQVTVSLLPQKSGMASVDEVITSLEPLVNNTIGPVNISFLRLSGGPPTTSPIELKIQGNDFAALRQASKDMMAKMQSIEGIRDIKSDDSQGQKALKLRLNHDAVLAAGFDADTINQNIRLLVDGIPVAAFQDQGEEVNLRIKAAGRAPLNINDLLANYLVAPNGEEIPLSELVYASYEEGPTQIVRYNFLRTITILADIDSELTDTRSANDEVLVLWQEIAPKYPSLQLERSGLLDDINESLSNIIMLFLFGMLLMYLIIASQFRSYFQPFIILFTVFLAFIGVVFGLTLSRQPFSLYSMYGAVALAGISVNAAIVLVSAANTRRNNGMSPLHAIVYASRRRVVPIIITSLTTIAGLSSLALGIGGQSAIWGPIAVVIVWGLGFSTVLTLFVIPSLYLGFERLKHLRVRG